MGLDSVLDYGAAVALFTAAMSAWFLAAPLPLSACLYLRFGGVLFSAMAVSVPLGLADAASLLLLPLASAALMVSALERFARPLPAAPACLALVFGLSAGLGALLSGPILLALVPVMIAGLAVIAAAIQRIAVIPVLAGAGLIASGLAFTEQEPRGGLMLFCAATLIGLSKPQLLRSSSSALCGETARP